MKMSRKVLIGVGGLVLLIGTGWFTSYQMKKGVVTVQTGQVVRQDVTSVVTASGEIRPAELHERRRPGHRTDHRHRGQGRRPREEGRRSLARGKHPAGCGRSGSSREHRRGGCGHESRRGELRFGRRHSGAAPVRSGQSETRLGPLPALYKEQLIAKQDYDATQSDLRQRRGGTEGQSRRKWSRLRAARDQASSMLDQNRAQLKHLQDVLRKTTYTAPIDGIVSYVAVRVGENVVPGIQNSQGSFLLTISDMSVVTSEVKVDETDITELKVGQPADVSIDAVPGQLFHGKVTQVGDLAILRTSGDAAMTATTANTQEARDFKVVVTLDNPPDGLRPGLSTTARIQTAQKKNVLTVPVQALAERTPERTAASPAEEQRRKRDSSRAEITGFLDSSEKCARSVRSSRRARQRSFRCKRESAASRTSK